MLRLSDLKLPLDHPESALADAILARLGIAAHELTGFTIARRGYDARKRGAITLIYAVDVETSREADLLARLQADGGATDGKLGPTPDTTYKFVAKSVHAAIYNEFLDIGRFPQSVLYDSGFSIDTKKAFFKVLSARKDVYVVVGTQDSSLPQNTQTDESSIALSVA